MTRDIPVLDLTAEVRLLRQELHVAIERVLASGQFILGGEVRAFEEEVAAFLGVPHAVGVNSGTDALIISLRALGVGPGDEVITTPFTFVATAEAISLVGATPVFVDIDPRSLNLDPQLIEAKIGPRTKAILPVHLFGQAANMDAIEELARRHRLRVLEDAAQAFGGRWRDRPVGTIGDVAAFSFFPTKNLGAYGDAGLIVTRSREIADLAAMLRTHGSKERYRNELLGYNSRLDSLQAAILRVKLTRVAAWNETRRQLARNYDRMLSGLQDVTVPWVDPSATHVYHQYTIRIAGGRRDSAHKRLAELGVGSMVYYPIPVHKLAVYEHLGISLPKAEEAAREVLSLPIWPQLDERAQETVAESLRAALRE